jgi:hypothetical protein
MIKRPAMGKEGVGRGSCAPLFRASYHLGGNGRVGTSHLGATLRQARSMA